MSVEPQVTYTTRPDATTGCEVAALAVVYGYIFDCHAKKKAARPGSPDDGTKFKEDSADAPIIPE
jgi:hypothetical protein